MILCPFCDEQIAEYQTTEAEPCCVNQDVIVDSGAYVCRSCGIVQRFEEKTEYIDFHENMFKIRRKSIYQRKYHIEDVINDICIENQIVVPSAQINKICSIFDETGKILPRAGDTRKRMISIKFILRKLFEMLDLPCEKIHISKSTRTLASYKTYWSRVMELIGDVILGIINK